MCSVEAGRKGTWKEAGRVAGDWDGAGEGKGREAGTGEEGGMVHVS